MLFSSARRSPLLSLVFVLAWGFAACSSESPEEDAAVGGASTAEPGEGEGGKGSVEAAAGAAGASEPVGPGEGGMPGRVEPEPEPEPEPSGGAAGEPEPEPDPGAGGRPSEEPEPEPERSEAELRGELLVEKNGCVTCHQANFAGFTVFPNITPDPTTGIGTWTDAQIIKAIRDGVDIDGEDMCQTMARYPFTDDEVADVVAFLRGLTPVKSKVASNCPGHGG